MNKYLSRLILFIILIAVFFTGEKIISLLDENAENPYLFTYENTTEQDIDAVFVAGSFNQWSSDDSDYRMTEIDSGYWQLIADIDPGKNYYKYAVYYRDQIEPEMIIDIRAEELVETEPGGLSSLVIIRDSELISHIFRYLILGITVFLFMLFILEPLIILIMKLPARFNTKLLGAVFVLFFVSNLAIFIYNQSVSRSIIRNNIIYDVDMTHRMLSMNDHYEAFLETGTNESEIRQILNKIIDASDSILSDPSELSYYGAMIVLNPEYRIMSVAMDQEKWDALYQVTVKDEQTDMNRYFSGHFFTDISNVILKKTSSAGIVKPLIFRNILSHIEDEEMKEIIPLLGKNFALIPIYRRNQLMGYYGILFDTSVMGIDFGKVILINIALSLIILLMTLILISHVGHEVGDSLKVLTDWTKQLVKGNFDIEINLQKKDEFGALAHNFNELRMNLGSHVKYLKLMNTVSAAMQSITNIDDLYKVFLSCVTSNFGLGYNRAAVFIKTETSLHGSYAIGMIDDIDVNQKFGSYMDYLGLRLDLDNFISNYKQYIDKIAGPFVDTVRSIEIDMFDSSFFWDVLNRKAVLYIHDDSQFMNEKDIEIKQKLNLKECVLLPLYKGEEAIGVIFVDNIFHNKPIVEKDIDQLQIILNDFSVNLENAYIIRNLEQLVDDRTLQLQKALDALKARDRIIRTDLSIAQRIQQGLLPRGIEQLNRLDFTVKYYPMSEVGGDIYDIVEIRPDYYRIFLADATGHGVQAALITMLIKGEYELIKTVMDNPAELLEILNNNYIANYSYLSFFFTCIVLDIDLQNEVIIYASGGHPNQFLLKENGVDELVSTGKIMGIMENATFKLEKTPFSHGDRVLLFTDGLFEQFNGDMQEYTDKRLYETALKVYHLSIPDLMDYLLSEVRDYMGGMEVNDDITMIGVDIS